MGGLRRAFWRLINAIHPDREEANLKREVASHLRLLEDEYRRRGLSANDAHRSARLAFGGIDHLSIGAGEGVFHRDDRRFCNPHHFSLSGSMPKCFHWNR